MTRYVSVTQLPGPLARIVKGALEAEGIPVRLEREAMSAVYGLDMGMFATRVLVPPEHLEQARALIKEVEEEE